MSRRHLIKLEAEAVLAAMQSLSENLAGVTKANASTILPDIIKRTEADVKAIERIREMRELVDLPDHE